MGDYRSKTYSDGRMQLEPYYGPTSRPNDFRSYSATYYSGTAEPPTEVVEPPPPHKLKKGKSTGGSGWSFSDPEMQRKKRVASYKVYSVEGKVKGSFRKSFRWIKDTYTKMMREW